MWSLVASGDKLESSVEFRLLSGVEYVVGRKNADILLTDDASISRKHAVLTVTHSLQELKNCSTPPQLVVADHSKFGTSVNDRLLSGSTCTLAHGDTVKFGQLSHVFVVKYKPLIVAASSLTSTDRSLLKQRLVELGAHLIQEPGEGMDVLVTGKPGMTVKVVIALACCKHVVTAEYFKALLEAVKKKTEEPSVVSYTAVLPDSVEDNLLIPNHQRRTLFTGKTFFYCNKSQFERMKGVVELAGGAAMLLDNKPRSFSSLVAKDSIVMHCDVNSQPPWYKQCITYLASKGRRQVQDAELGLALLHCSTENHCNPQQEAGSRLHEEFSQKVNNTQIQTQSCNVQSTPHSYTRLSTNTADHPPTKKEEAITQSECFTKPPARRAVRESAQKITESVEVKHEPTNSGIKRIAESQQTVVSKRQKPAVIGSPVADSKVLTQLKTETPVEQTIECTVTSTNPLSQVTVVLPPMGQGESDRSVVEETQSSAADEDETSMSAVDVGRLRPSEPKVELTEERMAEIGNCWNTILVDYQVLLHTPRISSTKQPRIPERRGQTLWKGKWVPNYKRFSKCGKREVALPTIIGEGDLVDALCSQPHSQPDLAEVLTASMGQSATPRSRPKTSMTGSIFGSTWQLPSK